MKTKGKHKLLYASILLLALTGGLTWLLRPPERYDSGLVDPRLTALETPYKSVWSGFVADGGSLGIIITDRNAEVLKIAIPGRMGDSNRHSRVFFGATYDTEPGAEEVPNPEHTFRMLESILQSRRADDPYADFLLFCMRKRTIDYIRCGVNRLTGRYEDN